MVLEPFLCVWVSFSIESSAMISPGNTINLCFTFLQHLFYCMLMFVLKKKCPVAGVWVVWVCSTNTLKEPQHEPKLIYTTARPILHSC